MTEIVKVGRFVGRDRDREIEREKEKEREREKVREIDERERK